MPTAPDNHDAHDYAERIRRKSITCLKSPFTKPNHLLPAIPLFSRVLRLRFPRLIDLRFNHLLRHQPPLRIRIRAPRVDRVHTHIQNVPATEAA